MTTHAISRRMIRLNNLGKKCLDEGATLEPKANKGSDPVTVAPFTASTSTLQRHASYNGTDQLLHVPGNKEMRNKNVKNIKLKSQRNLSVSTPVMPPSRSSTPDLQEFTPHTNKSRNKKFHRIWKHVPNSERVVNYFSCALVSEILLQGHLYITENYFGFYSNVFGHVTKILIHVSDVKKISKERTAKIIPNAVGIITAKEKHIFSSLLSRETTFKLMSKVWTRRINLDPGVKDDSDVENNETMDAGEEDDDDEDEDEDDYEDEVGDDESESGDENNILGHARTSSESGCRSYADADGDSAIERTCSPTSDNISMDTISSFAKGNITPIADIAEKCQFATLKDTPKSQVCFQKTGGTTRLQKLQGGMKSFILCIISLSRPTILLLISTVLLLFLLLSAVLLMYRLHCVQHKLGNLDEWNTESDFKVQLFQEIFKWQRRLHDTSVSELHETLETDIYQLAQVRRSLQSLLMMLEPDVENLPPNEVIPDIPVISNRKQH